MAEKIWILNYKAEDLKSVENISSCLVNFYREFTSEADVEVLNLFDVESLSFLKTNHRESLEKLKTNPPTKIIVVHPSVNHHPFFRSLLLLCKDVQFLIHLFGNFTRNAEGMKSCESLMRGKKIQFLAASESYSKVMANFIPPENLSIFPFPVNSAQNVQPLKSTDETIRLLYAGRFHDQKNVPALIVLLNDLSKKTGLKIHLTLVTFFDDFNPTTLNKVKNQGEQFQKFLSAIKDQSLNFSITLKPHLHFKELQKYYSENDGFISFSTFFDEDYGCSVLEALSAGLPAVVTLWGGYGDFVNKFPDYCLGLAISEEEGNLLLQTDNLEKYLIKIKSFSLDQRLSLAAAAREAMSHKLLSEQLKKAFSNTHAFSGFNDMLVKISNNLRVDTGIELFKKIYDPFWTFSGKK